jgi:hypothetical protein
MPSWRSDPRQHADVWKGTRSETEWSDLLDGPRPAGIHSTTSIWRPHGDRDLWRGGDRASGICRRGRFASSSPARLPNNRSHAPWPPRDLRGLDATGLGSGPLAASGSTRLARGESVAPGTERSSAPTIESARRDTVSPAKAPSGAAFLPELLPGAAGHAARRAPRSVLRAREKRCSASAEAEHRFSRALRTERGARRAAWPAAPGRSSGRNAAPDGALAGDTVSRRALSMVGALLRSVPGATLSPRAKRVDPEAAKGPLPSPVASSPRRSRGGHGACERLFGSRAGELLAKRPRRQIPDALSPPRQRSRSPCGRQIDVVLWIPAGRGPSSKSDHSVSDRVPFQTSACCRGSLLQDGMLFRRTHMSQRHLYHLVTQPLGLTHCHGCASMARSSTSRGRSAGTDRDGGNRQAARGRDADRMDRLLRGNFSPSPSATVAPWGLSRGGGGARARCRAAETAQRPAQRPEYPQAAEPGHSLWHPHILVLHAVETTIPRGKGEVNT